MLKVLFSTLAVIAFIQSFSQNIVISGHQNDSIFYGQVFSTVIKNTGDSPAIFYPRFHKQGRENIFLSENDYYSFINSQITATDSTGMVIQCLNTLASIYKSFYFYNNLLLFSEYGNQGTDSIIFAKKVSVIGSKLSQFHRQCGDYNRSGIEDLHRALNIPYSALHQVSHIGHATAEVFVEGNWIHFDLDPGTPGFLQTNPASPNGYASTLDLVNDTGLIQNHYLYDSMSTTSETMEEYRTFFPSAQPYPVQFTNETDSLSGSITLCSGCYIEWNYTLDSTTVLIDTSDIIQKDALNKILQYYNLFQQGNSNYADSVLFIFSNIFGFNEQQVIEIFEGMRPMIIYYKHFSPSNFQQLYTNKVPTIKLYVPSSSYAVNIGEDLKMPFLLTNVNTSGTVIVGDTTISGVFSAELWNDKSDTLNINPPFVQSKVINYLKDGVIPAGVSVEFTLAYNPSIINFGRGLEIDQLDNNDTLEILVSPQPDITVSVAQSSLTENDLHVFPNPVNNNSFVKVRTEVGNISVYDLMGKKIQVNTNIEGNHLLFQIPVAGTYIITNGHAFKRIIVY